MRKSKRKNYILQKCPTIDHSILLDNAFTYERKWQIPAINGDRRIPTILPISRQDFHVKGFSRIAKLEERKLIERVSKRRTWKRSKGFIFRLFSILLFLEFFRNDTCLKINFVKLILPEFHLFDLSNLRVFLISIIENNRNVKWKFDRLWINVILIIRNFFVYIFTKSNDWKRKPRFITNIWSVLPNPRTFNSTQVEHIIDTLLPFIILRHSIRVNDIYLCPLTSPLPKLR